MHAQDEYEVVTYPRLHHVKIDTVDIIYRNLHVHREMELCLALEGSACVRVNARAFSIRKGSVFFFNSNEPHEIDAGDHSGVRIVYIQLASNFCQDYLSLFRNLELMENDLSSRLSPEQSGELARLILRAADDYGGSDSLHLLDCMSSVCLLFGRLLRSIPYRQLDEGEVRARKKKTERLRRITEYIDANYSDRLTLAELARSEGVTLSYLSHFIHDNLNMTFQDYVNNVRFEKALELLANAGMRMVDVCMESGFSDVKYLNRMFEKRLGCTAREYRRARSGDGAE